MSTPSSPKPRSRGTIGILVLVIVVAALIGIYRMTAAKPVKAGAGVVPVTMTVAAARDVNIAAAAIGTVVPVAQVTVTSRVGGTLLAVNCREGQMVKPGDLLAEIDPGPYAAALEQARGQLTRDEAQLANAKLDLERYEAAGAKHAVPEQQVAAQRAIVQAGEGTVQFDKGGVAAAELNLGYTRILSPIEGRVGLRMVDPGNNIAANGTNGLLTVVQLSPITVVFTLPQTRLREVLAGEAAGGPLRVEAFDRSGGDRIAQGTLLTIDNAIDPTTGTFRLKATFSNQDLSLWPGQFVSLRFLVGVRKNVVTLPDRAVQQGPEGDYVFVVNPDMTVSQRTVATASTDEGTVVIEQGVAAGERVVLDGQYRLQDGAKVSAGSPAPAAGKGSSGNQAGAR